MAKKEDYKLESGNRVQIPGGGGTPYYGLYRDAAAERGTLFRLQVYAKVGNILVEEYERVGKSVISDCKKSQKD